MHTGKLAESILKRSVLRQLKIDRSNDGEQYGADCAVFNGNADALSAYTAVGVVPGFERMPGKLVIAAANNLAAGGAVPEALMIQALLPPGYEESCLKADMRQLADEANKHHMKILGGHTEVTAGVNRPQYLVTGIGHIDASMGRPEMLHPGQELILTKWIALAGTAALAAAHEERLKARYPFTLIDRAKEFEKLMSVEEEARAITHFDTAAMHDLSQGGIFGALWEMSERAGVGLEVDLKKIPVKQETIEICEYFDINPYYLYSAGALLVGTDRGDALVARLAGLGIPASVIGQVTDGNDRIIRNGEDVRFLDRPKQDEWYRISESENAGGDKNERTDFNIS